jgi:3-hydroxyisobutyrate dehydrogenase-like beta-hydroxyacid dehydrogenase
VLSILPPGDAAALAERLARLIGAGNHKPVYVDCNAVSPDTAKRIAGVITEAGCPFADCGIIGAPPRPGYSPVFYASGAAAPRFAELAAFGLDIRVIGGAAGAASALKMCYGGITKGATALGSAVFLAATRAGVDDALHAELAASQPAVFGWLCRQIPRMYSKAYRFVDEMDEVSDFTAEDAGAREMFHGFARLYERIAEDEAGDRRETKMLEDFVRGQKKL